MRHGIKILFLLLSISTVVSAQKYIAQDGRLLDANNRLGSMGWNSSGSIDALSNRNNGIITGNVTGGMRFQAAVPYSSGLEFQGVTNSTLTNFRRDSVGVGQLSQGLHSGQLYIDSTRSLATSYNGNIVNTQSIGRISTMVGQQVRVSVSSNFLDNSLARSNKAKISLGSVVYNNAVSSAIPGVSYLQGGITSSDMAMDLAVRTRENTRIDGLANVMQNRPRLQRSVSLSFTENSPISIDEQMYLDQWQPERIFEEDITGNRAATVSLTAQQLDSRYQEYFQMALTDMKKGEYYKAADNFESASIFAKEDNGEIFVYIALARFATGQYISSSLKLYEAFNISFEQAISVVDIEMLFGSDQLLFKGVKNLESRYELTKNSSMLFLKGYLEYLANDLISARNTFKELSDLNPDDKVFARILEALAE